VSRQIIQVIEGRPLFRHLTVEENLRVGAITYDSGRHFQEDAERVFHYFPRLRDLRRRTSGYLSGGEAQMLVIGRALMGHPKLLMLDEPSLGLAPMLVAQIFEIVREINVREGISLLVVEQNARVALQIADYGYVMENGRVVLDGPAEQLRENEDIKEFYLGLNQMGERKSYREVKHYKRRKRWLG
jgi:branched-chain amino acid transport system ATP-binding protein